MSEPAWWVSFSQPTASFTQWAGAARTRLAASSLHPFEYDPVANSWTTKSATYPDNQVNNMACGVLTDAGTPYIYCVGGSARLRRPTATDRVFRYNPVTDTISAVAAPWPADAAEQLCPVVSRCSTTSSTSWAGSTDSRTAGKRQTRSGSLPREPTAWVQKNTVLPVPLGYIPTTTIGNLIYTGGGQRYHRRQLCADTTNSFVYDPVADTITTIASIPQGHRRDAGA